MLPDEVIEKIKDSLYNYSGAGMSVMEINRTSPEYREIVSGAETLLRELMSIPQNYRILFMQGGSETQYSAIPLNLLSEHKCADYVISGQISKRAALEAKKYGDIAIAASSAGAMPTYSTVPDTKRSDFRPDADYVYICFNNTLYGTKYYYIPDTGNIPLVADMSSFLLSEPIDVSKFALIYANAECGIGISGLTIVIVRDDIVSAEKRDMPITINYKAVDESDYTLNTASAWSIYVAKLVFEWIKSLGGVEEIKRRNERKASLVYDYLDSQTYYTAPVDKKCRSMMNLVFVTGDASLDKKFAKQAKRAGLLNLGGHESVGGMCASIYNAMPPEGVEKLVEFMKKFAQQNPKLEA
jgi:phosphoserine aminotransferase